jgi:hypothetical protein
MTGPTTERLRRLASPHRPPPAGPPARRATALLLRLGCVALLGWIGYVHLHLWLEGYRHIPTNGPLFLLDAVAGLVLAALLLVWPRPLTGLLAAAYTAATLGALLISLTVSLFGFRESISASYVSQSLAIEAITVLALLSWTVLATAAPRPPGSRRPDGARSPSRQVEVSSRSRTVPASSEGQGAGSRGVHASAQGRPGVRDQARRLSLSRAAGPHAARN